MKYAKVFSLAVFFASAALKCLSSLIGSMELNIVSTVLLIPSLTAYYLLTARRPDPYILIALALSTVGDMFMLDTRNGNYLVLGIGSFLLSLVFFTAALVRPVGRFKSLRKRYYFLLLPYIAFGTVIFIALRPYLGALLIPCAIYLTAILLRSFAALCRRDECRGRWYWFLLIGSILFIASDSIVAFNVFQFKNEMKYGAFLAAITYVPAQFLLVLGFRGSGRSERPA
jgi:uncharacterized membrane protein YhhN